MTLQPFHSVIPTSHKVLKSLPESRKHNHHANEEKHACKRPGKLVDLGLLTVALLPHCATWLKALGSPHCKSHTQNRLGDLLELLRIDQPFIHQWKLILTHIWKINSIHQATFHARDRRGADVTASWFPYLLLVNCGNRMKCKRFVCSFLLNPQKFARNVPHSSASLSTHKLTCGVWNSVLYVFHQSIQHKHCTSSDVDTVTSTTYQAMKFAFTTAKGYGLLIAAACIHETVVDEMDSARCRAPRGLVRAPICIAETLQDPLTLTSFADFAKSWFWITKFHSNVSNLFHKSNHLTQTCQCCNRWTWHARSKLLYCIHQIKSFTSNV